MGSAERHSEVKVQKLQVSIFDPEERRLEIESVSVVQEMGFRKDDDRGNLKDQLRLHRALSETRVDNFIKWYLYFNDEKKKNK